MPGFLLRELFGGAPKEIETVNRLDPVFRHKDALLAEINPLVTTPSGVFAADAKLIVDDNALGRQGIRSTATSRRGNGKQRSTGFPLSGLTAISA